MKPPVFDLHNTATLGQYHPGKRLLSLNAAMVHSSPWATVIEVLKHEMAHQYVFEVLGEFEETAHGPTFRRICRERGVDAKAAGLPEVVDPLEQNLIRKVKALLALSQSDNPHEAEAAARAARRRVVEHDLDLAKGEVTYTFRQLEPTKSRFDPWEKVLGGILTEHFGVSAIYMLAFRPATGRWGRALEIMGPHHHVEIAAYVHDVLRQTGEHLWVAHKKRQGLTQNKDRRTFLYGVLSGFRETLDREVKSGEAALIKVDDPRMLQYFSLRHPRVIAGSRYSIRRNETLEEGRRAGRSITIRPGVSASGEGPKAITQR